MALEWSLERKTQINWNNYDTWTDPSKIKWLTGYLGNTIVGKRYIL